MGRRKITEIRDDIARAFDEAPRDEETGEILIDKDWLDSLYLEEDEKYEGAALLYKECIAMRDACKKEAETMLKRSKGYERDAEGLLNYMTYNWKGKMLETPKVVISFRNSKRLIVDDEKSIPKEWVKTDVVTKIDKAGMKDAIVKGGASIPGVHVEEYQNIQVR